MNLLIFPNHLFSTLSRLPADTVFHIIESEEYFTRFTFHKQKLILHRASMQAMRERLLTKGFEVEYLDIQQYPNLESVVTHLKKRGVTDVEHFEITDHTTYEDFLQSFSKAGITTKERSSDLFLLTRENISSLGQNFTHAKVYEAARKVHGLLVDAEGKPVGGRWSFATLDRDDTSKELPGVTEMEPNRYVDEAQEYIATYFSHNPGATNPFIWPVTHNDAKDWLADFQDDRLIHFAARYDLLSDSLVGAHSALSPFLNIGLLTPLDVCKSILEFGERKNVPLVTIERYIREVAGTREFLRAQYLRAAVLTKSTSKELPKVITFLQELEIRLADFAYLPFTERLIVAQYLLMTGQTMETVVSYFMEHMIDSVNWNTEIIVVQLVQSLNTSSDRVQFMSSSRISEIGGTLSVSEAGLWDSLLLLYLKNKAQKNIRAQQLIVELKRLGVTTQIAKKFLQK